MEIKQNLCPSNKYNIKCPYTMTPIGVCIHNTANDAPAKNEIAYMLGNNNKVSYHYAVDDIEIIQAIPHNRNAWHAGDGNGIGNRKYISIEICYSKSGGKKFEAGMKNAAWLTAKILKDYGWDISHVKKHQDFSGKYCPHRILDSYGWQYFLNLVQNELNGATINTSTISTTNNDILTVKVTADSLNVRDGAGTNYSINTSILKGEIYTIVDRKDHWGLLKSGVGWINLNYVTIVGTTKTVKSTSVDEALSVLVANKMINTVDYWNAHINDIPYITDLIIKMANVHLRNDEKNGFTNVQQALDAMTKAGIINTPNYWLENYAKVQYLDTLIMRFANRLWI